MCRASGRRRRPVPEDPAAGGAVGDARASAQRDGRDERRDDEHGEQRGGVVGYEPPEEEERGAADEDRGPDRLLVELVQAAARGTRLAHLPTPSSEAR